jgi:phosphate butyryltransferase
MQTIKSLNDLIVFLQERGDKKRVAVVCGTDASTRYALEKGREMGFVEPVYVDGSDKAESARRAVAMVRQGEADILMKGLINTDVLLRAILDKETGILRQGRVLTHICVAEIPKYEKLLFITDAAVIPVPTIAQRRQQIGYINYACHAMGIEEPRIALIHCAEKVSEKTFPYTKDYMDIIAEAQTGKFGRCIIDGPLDLKTSLDQVSLREKGIRSAIDGQADALIFPNIVAGNVFYKTLTLFAYAKTACVLQGTKCPCVVPSRADSPEAKYYSLALAAL